MIVLVLLHVHKGRLVVEVKSLGVIVLVHARGNGPNIVIHVDDGVLFGVQILDNNLGFAVAFAVNGDEVFERVKLGDQ